MSKARGSTRTESLVSLHFPQSYEVSLSTKPRERKSFVFVEHVRSRIFELSKISGSRKVYQNFVKGISRGLYSTYTIYGLQAICVDDPYRVNVSVGLNISFYGVNEKAPEDTVQIIREVL